MFYAFDVGTPYSDASDRLIGTYDTIAEAIAACTDSSRCYDITRGRRGRIVARVDGGTVKRRGRKGDPVLYGD